jgi:hypothetical protein
VCFCAHIVHYRFLKKPYIFLAVWLTVMFMIIISANLRHYNGTISDMSLVKSNRSKFECGCSDTNCYVMACKELYWSHRLGDVRVTNFQQETCNFMRQSRQSVCRLLSQRPSKCLWYSVVIFCQRLQRSMEMAASVRRRLRTRVRGERSSAQTVKLRPKQCRAEPLAFEGPSTGGWGWVLVLP